MVSDRKWIFFPAHSVRVFSLWMLLCTSPHSVSSSKQNQLFTPGERQRKSSVTVVQFVQFFPFCFFKQMLKWKRMLMTFPPFASKSSSLLLLILLTSLTLTCCLWFLCGHRRAGDDSDLQPHHTSVTFLQERSTTNCVKRGSLGVRSQIRSQETCSQKESGCKKVQ